MSNEYDVDPAFGGVADDIDPAFGGVSEASVDPAFGGVAESSDLSFTGQIGPALKQGSVQTVRGLGLGLQAHGLNVQRTLEQPYRDSLVEQQLAGGIPARELVPQQDGPLEMTVDRSGASHDTAAFNERIRGAEQGYIDRQIQGARASDSGTVLGNLPSPADALQSGGKGLSTFAEKVLKDNPEWQRSPELINRPWTELLADPKTRGAYLARAFGENAPNLGAGIAAAVGGGLLLGPGGAAGGASLFTTTLETGYSFDDLRKLAGDDEAAAETAQTVGVVNAFLETLPINRLLLSNPILRKTVLKSLTEEVATDPMLRRMMKEGLSQAAAEGVTEGLQELMANVGKRVYKTNQDLFEGVTESMFVGSLLGGGAGLASGMTPAESPEVQAASSQTTEPPDEAAPAGDTSMDSLYPDPEAPQSPEAQAAAGRESVPEPARPDMPISPQPEALQQIVQPEAQSQPEAAGQQQTRSRFQQPDEYADQAHREKVEKHKLSPEAAADFAPNIKKNKLDYFADDELMPTLERAQKHRKETGEEAHIVYSDISNMGGGNEYFADKGGEVAFDEQFFIPMAQKLVENLQVNAPEADIVPIRWGGDELNHVIVNATSDQIDQAMQATLGDISKLNKELGLSDIKHKSMPDSPERGVGLYYGVEGIEPGEKLGDIMKEVARKVALNKLERKGVRKEKTGIPGVDASGGQAGRIEDGAAAPAKGIPGSEKAEAAGGTSIERDQGLNYVSPKLKRENYRSLLKSTVNKLVEGGGISLTGGDFSPANANISRDKETQVRRTPSVNPKWFQRMAADPETSMSVADVKTAVQKALAGERLGMRQARVVETILGEISLQRTDPDQIAYIRSERARARELRQLVAQGANPNNFSRIPAEFYDDAGHEFVETEYYPEMTGSARSLLELADQAEEAGFQDEVEAILSKDITDPEMAREQFQLIEAQYEKPGEERQAGAEKDTGKPAEQAPASTAEEAQLNGQGNSVPASKATPESEDDVDTVADAKPVVSRNDKSSEGRAGSSGRKPPAGSIAKSTKAPADAGVSVLDKPLTLRDLVDSGLVTVTGKGQQSGLFDQPKEEANGTAEEKAGEAPAGETAGVLTDAAPADLFGKAPVKEQAAADAQRAVDEKLGQGKEEVPVGLGDGDLFSGKSKQMDIADAAAQAATSPKNDLPEPSEAQREAGNYKKGHVRINGLDISIENPAGSRRRPEWPVLKHHYGYIKGTVGKDKDHIDVFLTDDAADEARPVFVVDQVNKSGAFDEVKVMLGFDSVESAKKGYLSNYSKGWQGLGEIHEASLDEFKDWLKNGKTKLSFAAGKARASVRSGVSGVAANEGQMPQSKKQTLSTVRGSRDKSLPTVDDQLQNVSGGRGKPASERDDAGARGQRQGVRAGQREVGDVSGTVSKQAKQSVDRVSGKKNASSGLGEGNRDTAADLEKQDAGVRMDSGSSADNAGGGAKKDLKNANSERRDAANGGLGKKGGGKLQDTENQDSERLASGEGADDDVGPLYSKESVVPGGKKPLGLGEKFVRQVATDFMKGVKADVIVTVQPTQEAAGGKDMKETVKAVFIGDELILIAENLSSRADVEAIIRHEIFSHYGFSLFPAETQTAIENRINETRDDPKYADTWQHVLKNYNDSSRSVQAQEFMAKLAETGKGRLTKLYYDVLAMIQKALRKLGWKGNITEAELQALLNAAERQARRGGEVGAMEPVYSKSNIDLRGTDATLDRIRPRNAMMFKTPYTGKSGAQLVGYEWKWRTEDIVDSRGEDKTVRVSDWEQSIINPVTNREIVHQFYIKNTDGKTELVSAETAAKMLGVSVSTARSSAKKLLQSDIDKAKREEQAKGKIAEINEKEWHDTPAEAIESLTGFLKDIWAKKRNWGKESDAQYKSRETVPMISNADGKYQFGSILSTEADVLKDAGITEKTVRLSDIWDRDGNPVQAEETRFSKTAPKGAVSDTYAPGEKHHGPVPEIRYLPVSAIERQEMDFRPEVMTVSDDIAKNMDYSEPVEVTAFRYGKGNDDSLPVVTLRDGHHRVAAAIQTGRSYLPVEVRAINAKGEKLNALIEMSRQIEDKLSAPTPGNRQTSTKAFRDWFKDSAVVDEDGQPLRVFHGTTVGGIDEFYENSHFGTVDQAESILAAEGTQYTSDTIHPVYLSIQNPKRVKDAGDFDSWAWEIERAKKEGYDGIVYLNRSEAVGESSVDVVNLPYVFEGSDSLFRDHFPDAKDSWIAFHPSQIKSAIGNRGTFDPNDPNIMFSKTTDPVPEPEKRKTFELTAQALKDGQPIDAVFRVPFEIARAAGKATGLSQAAKDYYARTLKSTGDFYTEKMPWIHPLMDWARAGIVDRYGLDQEYIKLDERRATDKRRVLLQAERFLKDMSIKGVTNPDEAKAFHAILTGDAMPQDSWAALSDEIKQAIADMGLEAVRLGLLTQEAYERNAGSYLHRVYLKHEGERSALGKFVNNLVRSRQKKLIGNELKGRGIFVDVAPGRLQRDSGMVNYSVGTEFIILDKADGTYKDAAGSVSERVYWPAKKPIPEKYNTHTNRGTFDVRRLEDGKVTLWRDYTKEEREKMGEILDSRYAVAKTFHLLANDLANASFLNQIATNPAWTWHGKGEPDGEVGEAKTGFMYSASTYSGYEWIRVPEAKIAGTKVNRWGDLAGKYVRAEIWRDLAQLDEMQKPSTWREIMTQFKLNKTARNPVVHMNNIMSNLMLMDMADIRFADLFRGIQSIRDRDEFYQEAEEFGAFGSSFIESDIKRNTLDPILEDMMKAQNKGMGGAEAFIESLDGLPLKDKVALMGKILDKIWHGVDVEIGDKKFKAGLKPFDTAMINAYQREDEFFRMAAFLRYRAQGMDAETAARRARDQFLDYDIRAPWVNLAKRTMLPFISYFYRAVPVVARSIAQRPWKLAKYFTIAYGLNALGYALSGGDEEDERKSMRDEVQGYTWVGTPRMIRMPWNDKNNDPVFLDVRRWVPVGDIFDTNMGQSALPIPAQLVPGGPIAIAFEFLLNKQNFTGKEIVLEKADDAVIATEKTLDWLWKSWMPAAPWVPNSWYWTKIDDAFDGAMDPLGREYSPGMAMLSSVGIKLQPHNVDLNMGYKFMEIEQRERAVRYELKQLEKMNMRKKIDPDVYEERKERYQNQLKKLAEEAGKLSG